MKTLLTLSLTFCSFAFAGQENAGVSAPYSPQAIYNALKVKAVAKNPGFVGVSRLEKSVGGLTCARILVVVPNATPKYECAVDQSKENFESIYNALKVKEVNLNSGIAGSASFEKTVGGLVCTRSTIVVPNAVPSYACTLAD